MPTLHQPVIAKPKAGAKIRKEDGTYLPDEGDTVTHSTYWARREKDGDVTLHEVSKSIKSKVTEPATK